MSEEHLFSTSHVEEELKLLAQLLSQLGCPAEKTLEMAQQLDRRASQLAETTGRSKGDALKHLIGLMRRGWSAQAKGVAEDAH